MTAGTRVSRETARAAIAFALSILVLALVVAMAVAVVAKVASAGSPADAPAAPPPSPAATPRSVLTGEPGYVAPVDPDSASLLTGRRPAKPTSKRFRGGAKSAEALAKSMLAAVAASDRAALERLCLERDEFAEILWPEFPSSRAVTGLTAQDGWTFLSRRNSGGISRLLNEHAGERLRFVRIDRARATESYVNFRLHRGLTIVARDSTGSEIALDDVRTIAERQGSYKIYSMRD